MYMMWASACDLKEIFTNDVLKEKYTRQQIIKSDKME